MYTQAIETGGLAVVTGAASGLGRVAALRFAQAGLGVVLADLPGDALEQATEETARAAGSGAPVLACPTDVRDDAAVAALADTAFEMGELAVLMNNAGIEISSGSWSEMEHWQAILNVNLWGVIHGVHRFVPRMIAANRPAAVINTGSKQGITTPPGNPAYNVSKAGVKVVTEQLSHDLRSAGVPISAHLFVPGFTYTGLIAKHMAEKPAAAWTPEQSVDYFLDRLAQGDFYILCPDNDVDAARDRRRAAWAVGDIIENRPALSRWHPEHAEDFAAFEADI